MLLANHLATHLHLNWNPTFRQANKHKESKGKESTVKIASKRGGEQDIFRASPRTWRSLFLVHFNKHPTVPPQPPQFALASQPPLRRKTKKKKKKGTHKVKALSHQTQTSLFTKFPPNPISAQGPWHLRELCLDLSNLEHTTSSTYINDHLIYLTNINLLHRAMARNFSKP
jgi:hypothetical protein